MEFKSKKELKNLLSQNNFVVQENRITIAVDAMSGTYAPKAIMEAIHEVCKIDQDLDFLVFGEVESISQFMKLGHEQRCKVISTASVISDDESPANALRYGKSSSMYGAISAVKTRQADVCISGGNTGALMMISKVLLGSIHGVKRPAIVSFFPTLCGKSVLLDLGANMELNEFMMCQFAVMGSCFAQSLLNIENPTVGLLNVGAEEVKGRSLEKKSYDLIKKSGLNFIGYIEGCDITEGKADVVVMDGFAGNVLLKASEGAASMCLTLLKTTCNVNWRAKLGAFLLKPYLKRSFSIVDPSANNGAMLVGLNGIVVKSHGNADIKGITNAIVMAGMLAKKKINYHIEELLEGYNEHGNGFNIVKRIKDICPDFIHKFG